jgi:hypothetical protein
MANFYVNYEFILNEPDIYSAVLFMHYFSTAKNTTKLNVEYRGITQE